MWWRGRKGGGKFGIIYGMRRQASRGTTWRGGIKPRRAAFSSRARASFKRDNVDLINEIFE